MVTRNKILFGEMDDRGSKSTISASAGIAVKEQRVNGYKYLHNLVIYLRCILMSLEISYGKKKIFVY